MKIMRLRYAKFVVALIIIGNFTLFYFLWKSTLWKNISSNLLTGNNFYNGMTPERPPDVRTSKHRTKANTIKNIRKSITIIFRTVYTFENDLRDSIDSILEVIPNMQILVLQEGVPYPPLSYELNDTINAPESSVRFINLGFDVLKRPEELNPLMAIHTKYVLFMPDSVRISNKSLLQTILRTMNGMVTNSSKTKVKNAITESPNRPDGVRPNILIVPFVGNIKSFSSFTEIQLDLPNWSIQYVAANRSDKCDLYLQKHAIMVDATILKNMSEPFGAPFPEMFYIQAKIFNISKTIFNHSFQEGRRLFVAYHTKQRRQELRRRQFKDMYKKLQIKRIVRRSHKIPSKAVAKGVDGGSATVVQQHQFVLDTQFSSSNFTLPQVTEIELIGCERTTKSCIGPVYNNRPFYMYVGKHTPPCCLDKLKTTFKHVMEEFLNVGIRYWLDNQALQTALETKQLSPDAFDIDISFNVNDLERSPALKKSQTKPFVDGDGFYWMKATDGHYFRVQFSKMNQIGVNLLPFEMKGNMVRPSGFFGWKAKEFSIDFLHPMSTVIFLGKKVMCPNNVREFLDAKNTQT